MTADLFFGIDPGVWGGLHGWAVLQHRAGMQTRWIASGHSTTDQIMGSLEAMRSFGSLGGVAIETAAGYVWAHYKGADLLSMNRAAGYLQGQIETFGVKVLCPASQDWRRVICGRGSAGDEAVSRAVRLHVLGVPLRAKAHELDAAGAALAVARGWKPPPPQLVLAQAAAKRRASTAKKRKAAAG